MNESGHIHCWHPAPVAMVNGTLHSGLYCCFCGATNNAVQAPNIMHGPYLNLVEPNIPRIIVIAPSRPTPFKEEM